MTRPVLLECPVCEGTGRVRARRVISHPAGPVTVGGQVVRCPVCLAQPLRLVEKNP